MLAAEYLPLNEAERLLAVQPYLHLPTKQQLFQDVVTLTAQLFGAPISIMSLVEAEQVQYPGNVGLPAMPARLARIECICSAAVYTSATTVFSDLRAQPCPWVSPAAQAQTDFQFYAGHPLLTAEGYAIGTLCVLDTHPRSFSAQEQDVLQRLAQLTMRLLDLHLALARQPTSPQQVWVPIQERLRFALYRIETITALARRGDAAAQGHQQDLYQQQLLLLEDLDYNISRTSAQVLAA